MVHEVPLEESIPSWLVHEEPLWLCRMDEEEGGLEILGSIEYVPEPFPEHEIEPFGWHDILATLDVCANVHATKHCDEEGYDIRSTYMVSVILDPNERETESSAHDEEIILEGPNMDPSRVTTSYVPSKANSQEIPLMPMKMEITSVEEVTFEGSERNENQNNEGEFYDASDEPLSDEEDKRKKPNRRERRALKKLKKAMLKLRNGVKVQVDLYLPRPSSKQKPPRFC